MILREPGQKKSIILENMRTRKAGKHEYFTIKNYVLHLHAFDLASRKTPNSIFEAQIIKKCPSAYNLHLLKIKFHVQFAVEFIQVINCEAYTSNPNVK